VAAVRLFRRVVRRVRVPRGGGVGVVFFWGGGVVFIESPGLSVCWWPLVLRAEHGGGAGGADQRRKGVRGRVWKKNEC